MDTLRPLLMIGFFTAVLCAVFLNAQRLLGPRQRTPVKDLPFECGNPPITTSRGKFSVKFYALAMLFIIFDVELILLFPWAAVYRKLGVAGFVEMSFFLAVVGVGFLYAWRKRALEWD